MNKCEPYKIQGWKATDGKLFEKYDECAWYNKQLAFREFYEQNPLLTKTHQRVPVENVEEWLRKSDAFYWELIQSHEPVALDNDVDGPLQIQPHGETKNG